MISLASRTIYYLRICDRNDAGRSEKLPFAAASYRLAGTEDLPTWKTFTVKALPRPSVRQACHIRSGYIKRLFPFQA